MEDNNQKSVEGGRANSNAPVDNLQLNNPYVGKKPFRVSYDTYDRPNMHDLITGEYSRIWDKEHDLYLKTRQGEKTTAFIKPDLNARKMPPKIQTETVEPPPIVRSKKYDNVQSKVNNGRKMSQEQ